MTDLVLFTGKLKIYPLFDHKSFMAIFISVHESDKSVTGPLDQIVDFESTQQTVTAGLDKGDAPPFE